MAGQGPQTYKIDQAATFGQLVLLQVEPKSFNGGPQETTKAGDLKWEAQFLAGFRGFGDKQEYSTIKVGLVGAKNPGEGIAPMSPVELIGFEIGVMERTKKLPDGTEKIIGVTVWHRAESMRSTASTGSKRASTEAAA